MRIVNSHFKSNKEKRVDLFKTAIDNFFLSVDSQQYITIDEIRQYFLNNNILDITGSPVAAGVLTDNNIMLFAARSGYQIVE